jgi:UrcA family protein
MDTNASSPKTSSSRLAAALSIGAVICAAAAGAATAQTTQQNVQAISIADLDLSSADGARAFLKRIDIAAQAACGGQPVNSPLFPREPGLFEKCVREAVTTAVRSTDEPMVASLHNEALTGSTTLASR